MTDRGRQGSHPILANGRQAERAAKNGERAAKEAALSRIAELEAALAKKG